MSEPNTVQTVRIIETPYDFASKNIVCYPNLLLDLKIRVFRLFMEPRIVYSTITVDLVKGQAARSNMFPNYEEIEISNTAVIASLISTETAIDSAKQLAFKWLRHKFRVYKVPDIEIIKQQEIYKAFFYTQDHNNDVILVDSVRGVELHDRKEDD